MNFIWDKIEDWLRNLLVSGIMSNLTGLFDGLNEKVTEIAANVGTTPQAWNSSIFNMIRSLSDNVMVPIAGIILTFVMVYELIQMVIERNNMHDLDTFFLFKWIFKAFISVLIVTNTWGIVMGVFELAQDVVNNAAGIIVGDATISIDEVVVNLEARLMEMDIGSLFGLWFQSMLMGLISWAISICVFTICYGRMIEIYLVTSLAPIPAATVGNREWGQLGQNYLKSLFALGFQAFLIIVCVAIYAVLVRTIAVDTDITKAVWTCIGYSVLLCFSLFKTSSLSKSVFGAH